MSENQGNKDRQKWHRNHLGYIWTEAEIQQIVELIRIHGNALIPGKEVRKLAEKLGRNAKSVESRISRYRCANGLRIHAPKQKIVEKRWNKQNLLMLHRVVKEYQNSEGRRKHAQISATKYRELAATTGHTVDQVKLQIKRLRRQIDKGFSAKQLIPEAALKPIREITAKARDLHKNDDMPLFDRAESQTQAQTEIRRHMAKTVMAMRPVDAPLPKVTDDLIDALAKHFNQTAITAEQATQLLDENKKLTLDVARLTEEKIKAEKTIDERTEMLHPLKSAYVKLQQEHAKLSNDHKQLQETLRLFEDDNAILEAKLRQKDQLLADAVFKRFLDSYTEEHNKAAAEQKEAS